jgi:hypothetical protein
MLHAYLMTLSAAQDQTVFNDKQIMMERTHKQLRHNPLEPELNAQCTLHKTLDLNGYPLFYTFLADKFSWHLVYPESHCMSAVVDFWHQRVNFFYSNICLEDLKKAKRNLSHSHAVTQPRFTPGTSRMKLSTTWDNLLSNFYDSYLIQYSFLWFLSHSVLICIYPSLMSPC